MNTVKQMANVSRHANHWLIELFFGVAGALVVMLVVVFFVSDAMAKPLTNDIASIRATDDSNSIDNALLLASSDNVPAAFRPVGSAKMSMLWFDIYSAKLYSLNGKYQNNQLPLKLEIKYHRDIEAADLIDATVEQWQHLGIKLDQINQYRDQLINAWPDVKQGDRLTFMVNTPSQAQFLFNDKPYYQVSNDRFPVDFLAIWLSENTSRPELRKQLIGVK